MPSDFVLPNEVLKAATYDVLATTLFSFRRAVKLTNTGMKSLLLFPSFPALFHFSFVFFSDFKRLNCCPGFFLAIQATRLIG
jgi:hypothetical protein